MISFQQKLKVFGIVLTKPRLISLQSLSTLLYGTITHLTFKTIQLILAQTHKRKLCHFIVLLKVSFCRTNSYYLNLVTFYEFKDLIIAPIVFRRLQILVRKKINAKSFEQFELYIFRNDIPRSPVKSIKYHSPCMMFIQSRYHLVKSIPNRMQIKRCEKPCRFTSTRSQNQFENLSSQQSEMRLAFLREIN